MDAGGFSFCTENDGKLAEAEQRKIEYLEARIDYTNAESILRVYDKAIQERIFRTPVGIMYLKKLQDFLLKQPKISRERVRAIPLYEVYSGTQDDAAVRKEPEKTKDSGHERKKAMLQVSVILNVLLVLAVCFMFIISFFSEQPNIFNYERALEDRYASWEDELTERERIVREKERELDIEIPDDIQNR